MEWGPSCSLSPQHSSSIPGHAVLAASREGTAASREGAHPGTHTSATHQTSSRKNIPRAPAHGKRSRAQSRGGPVSITCFADEVSPQEDPTL